MAAFDNDASRGLDHRDFPALRVEIANRGEGDATRFLAFEELGRERSNRDIFS